MNKRGFTLVELISSFALSSIIIVLLLNLILTMKNIYTYSGSKTEMLIEQSNLSKNLNEILDNGNITNYTTCTDTSMCYQFTHINGNTYKLVIDDTLKTITFNNYTYKLSNTSELGTVSVKTEYAPTADTTVNNSFLIINIPIYNKLFEGENLGINIVYPYNSYETSL